MIEMTITDMATIEAIEYELEDLNDALEHYRVFVSDEYEFDGVDFVIEESGDTWADEELLESEKATIVEWLEENALSIGASSSRAMFESGEELTLELDTDSEDEESDDIEEAYGRSGKFAVQSLKDYEESAYDVEDDDEEDDLEDDEDDDDFDDDEYDEDNDEEDWLDYDDVKAFMGKNSDGAYDEYEEYDYDEEDGNEGADDYDGYEFAFKVLQAMDR